MDQASLFDTEATSENESALNKGSSQHQEDYAALTESADRTPKEAKRSPKSIDHSTEGEINGATRLANTESDSSDAAAHSAENDAHSTASSDKEGGDTTAEAPEHAQAAARAAELRHLLDYHAYRYYALDAPEITDAAFDKLLVELQRIEAKFPDLVTPDSYTQRVGGYVGEQFAPVTHMARM